MGDAELKSRWPLLGLRILEIASEIAGPYCGKLFVDAGAEVVKLEPPDGDPLRRWSASGAAIAEGESGALFQFLNASKRSLRLELATAAGRERVRELAAGSDLVIDAAGPGLLAECGLGLAALQVRNPALCMLSISPFGASGPWAKRPATEWTLQAQAGATLSRGLPDREPIGAGGRIGEWLAGAHAGVAALFALLAARGSGAGQWVDVSIFEAISRCMTTEPDLAAQFGAPELQRSPEVPSIEPARDGFVGLCTYTAAQWRDLCTMIGRPELADDERLLDTARRWRHRELVQEVLHPWTRERSVAEIIEQATRHRVPAAPVGDGRNLPEMDHMRQRGIYVLNPGGFIQPRPPWLLAAPLRPIGRAPALGEHEGDAALWPLRERWGQADGEGGSGLPLAGLRVVDLTAFWAGPLATSYLAEMGADVIKVESTQRPDGMRFAAGKLGDSEPWEWSFVFHGANSSKRDITLNLDSEEGRALLRRLIERADLLIDNFSARVMDDFGLGWEVVHGWNPRLVMARMPAFGLDGPWRERPGFAANVEQVCGLAWITGYPDDVPLTARGLSDPLGGLHAVFAILLALEDRRHTGLGQLVEVPLVEPGLNVAAEVVIEYSAYGARLERGANRSHYAAPQGVYPSLEPEGFVALAVVDDAQWRALVGLLGQPAWATDPALASHAGRRSAHDRIDAGLRSWLAQQPRDAAVERMLAAGVPAAPVAHAQQLHPNPQLEQRGFFCELQHPHTGPTRYAGLPARFSGFAAPLRRSPAPTLGQHNDEVLRGELGLSQQEIERLRAAGIIGERPAFM